VSHWDAASTVSNLKPWPEDLVSIVEALRPQSVVAGSQKSDDGSSPPLGLRYRAVGTVEVNRAVWEKLLELAGSDQRFVLGQQIVSFARQPIAFRSQENPDLLVAQIELNVRSI
jgi:hypothetical protein